MTSTKEKAHRQGLALTLLCLAQFMVVLDFSIVNVALPSMQRELGFSTQNLQWVVSAYSLTLGGFLLLGGRLADLYGRRLLFMLGLALFSLASLAGGLAPSSTWLIIDRAIQGLGAALVAPAALSLITTTFAEGPARNKAFALVGALASAGFAVGAILGGLLTAGPGWRWVMFVNVPIGIIAVSAAPVLLRESRARLDQRRVDVLGALTVTSGLMVLVYALSQGNGIGWLSAQIFGLLALAAVLLLAFVVIELRSASPLVRLAILRQRTVTGANIVNMFAPGAFGALVFILTLYMQRVLGYSALTTGLAFLPMAAVILIFSNVVSRLVSRFGVKPFLVGGITGLVIGLLLLTPIAANGNYVSTLLPGILAVSMGMGPTFATMVIAATAGVSDNEQGLASGLFNTTQQVGSGLVLAVVVAASSARTAALLQHGGEAGKAATTAGLQYALFACVGFALLAALAALFVIRERRNTGGLKAAAPSQKSLAGDRSISTPASVLVKGRDAGEQEAQ
jgi:EmrB/QacA subfamily drug resistance transporter